MVHFSEIFRGLVDPLLCRRAGISMSLIGAWSEIVGEASSYCRPDKILWTQGDFRVEAKNGLGRDDSSGVLVVACEGSRALFLMHDQSRIIASVNDFFGFCVVNRMRIVQKPMIAVSRKKSLIASISIPVLKEEDCKRIDEVTEGIENEHLRKALTRFGYAVIRSSYI
ncbi:DUF721 domain-containing protein [Candidatus Liberibacter sp.]|uniref:DUF721 domain-containing protein n=1 Tax=Candidatus Liberibacter sp. TaxID=34022 RepID=UPI0015F68A48|nr:DciA family protein [Candidatus Liberibacter sp.]MBA5724142.1 DUF721 domain-containing protein [Candidatus Liberibacter sp.]